MQVLFSKIDSSLLFDPNLISQKLQQQLPTGFVLRPLNINDFDKGSHVKSKSNTFLCFLGFVFTLGQLSVVEGLDKSKFESTPSIFDYY